MQIFTPSHIPVFFSSWVIVSKKWPASTAPNGCFNIANVPKTRLMLLMLQLNAVKFDIGQCACQHGGSNWQVNVGRSHANGSWERILFWLLITLCNHSAHYSIISFTPATGIFTLTVLDWYHRSGVSIKFQSDFFLYFRHWHSHPLPPSVTKLPTLLSVFERTGWLWASIMFLIPSFLSSKRSGS